MKILIAAAAALFSTFLMMASDTAQAAQGCGPGMARGPRGFCRPIGFVVRPVPRCEMRMTPRGMRRFCF